MRLDLQPDDGRRGIGEILLLGFRVHARGDGGAV